jgi:hypothetical protein
MLADDASSGTPVSRNERVLRVAAGVSLFLVLLAVARCALVRARELLLVNHDIAWFLHAGEVWLDGGKIGADVVDTNPPLVIWLSGLEVWAARVLGCAPFVLHALVSCAVSLLGVVLAARAFARAGVPRDALAAWAPLALTAAAAAAGYDFGQREHWLALLLLPYAGWALVPTHHTGAAALERALAGLLAALAVALKPHYVVAVAVIELAGVLRLRSARQLLRVESLCAAGCAPLYLLAIAWSAPSFWKDLEDTLSVYAAYGREVPLWSEHTQLALGALVLAAPVGLVRPRTVVPLLLAALALASVVAAWLQHKNFAYHHVPTDFFAYAALALSLGLALARLLARAGPRPPGTAALLGAVTVACLAVLWGLPRVPRDPELRSALGDGIRRFAPGERVFVFSTAVGATFPTVPFVGARSLSPFSCLWQIAGNYTPEERVARPFRYRTLDEMTEIERRTVERVIALLARERPALLVFDRRPLKQGFGFTAFDLQRYFEAHPAFGALVGSYRSLARDDCFEYYGRRGE